MTPKIALRAVEIAAVAVTAAARLRGRRVPPRGGSASHPPPEPSIESTPLTPRDVRELDAGLIRLAALTRNHGDPAAARRMWGDR